MCWRLGAPGREVAVLQHPTHIRRAVRVLAMVGELHKRGYQRLRVMPYMAPSGMHRHCTIGAAELFYRNHGAILSEIAASDSDDQATAEVARYTSAEDNHYFGWTDAEQDNARSLADKFVKRFSRLVDRGKGWDYGYAGWYVGLQGLADACWLPVVLSDYTPVVYDHIPLTDVRPEEQRLDVDEAPSLPLPPPGSLQRDHPG
jgi:hypothetical protein